MIKYILINTNNNRDIHYDDETKPPFWLAGTHVQNSSGESTSDITRAHLYNEEKAAQRQADKLTKKFSVEGRYFCSVRNGLEEGLGYRYPDSVGKKGYGKYAPTYEVRTVKVSVAIVTD